MYDPLSISLHCITLHYVLVGQRQEDYIGRHFASRAGINKGMLDPNSASPLPSSSMNASRTDLLAWLNDLLQLNYTKVEQCGTGGAYCQIIDSVYGARFPRCRLRWVSDWHFPFPFLLALRAQATYPCSE